MPRVGNDDILICPDCDEEIEWKNIDQHREECQRRLESAEDNQADIDRA